MSDVVGVERKGQVALITLNRPEARNAISPEMLVRLADAWTAVRDDPDIRVAVVTGAGDKAFCSGADLGRFIPLMSRARPPEDEWDRRLLADGEMLGRGLLRTFDVVKPVIAAINGHAIAGGMELAQGTDLRVASESAKLGVQEVKWVARRIFWSRVRNSVRTDVCGDRVSCLLQALESGFVEVFDIYVLRCQYSARAKELGVRGESATRLRTLSDPVRKPC